MHDIVMVLADRRVVFTAVFVVAILVLRWFLVRAIRGDSELLSETQRRWIANVRNGALGIIVAGVVIAWMPEIETFALSITAIAVALVIATKELILCISGTLYRASSKAFQIGDWIELGPYFGEVVDHGISSTTLQEVNQQDCTFTGRTLVLPNSLLLTQPVINQNFRKRYTFYTIELIGEPDADPVAAIPILKQVIDRESADFAEVAGRYNAMIEKRTGVDIPGAEPRFSISTSELAKPVIEATVFCPTDRIRSLRMSVMEAYYEWYFEARKKPYE